MTLIIGVLTGDGIVLAGDSRTSQAIPEKPARVLSDFTHKVFKVGECAVATSGWAFLSGRNVAAHMADLVQEIPSGADTPEAVCKALATFFRDRYKAHIDAGIDESPGPGLNTIWFIVAGYSEGVGQAWEVALPTLSVRQLYTTETGGLLWLGNSEVVARIVKGYCPTLEARLVGDEAKLKAFTSLRPALDGLEYIIQPKVMNIQDAVDLAVVLIRTTIDLQRLTNGMVSDPGAFPGVGGPIEIALLNPAGFSWIQQTTVIGERPRGVAEDV